MTHCHQCTTRSKKHRGGTSQARDGPGPSSGHNALNNACQNSSASQPSGGHTGQCAVQGSSRHVQRCCCSSSCSDCTEFSRRARVCLCKCVCVCSAQPPKVPGGVPVVPLTHKRSTHTPKQINTHKSSCCYRVCTQAVLSQLATAA